MALALAALLIGGVIGLLLLSKYGLRVGLLSASLIAICLIPFGLIKLEPETEYVTGVAPTVVTISTYTVVIIAGLLLAISRGTFHRGALWSAPLVVALVVNFSLVWAQPENLKSGALHFTLVALAWSLGVCLGQFGPLTSQEQLELSRVLAIIMAVFAVSVLVQLIMGDTVHNRASGLFSHPALVGKLTVFLLALTLPLSLADDKRARRNAIVAIVLGAIATMPTLARANIVALLLVLCLWALTLPGKRAKQARFVIPLLALVAFVPFSGEVIGRFESDTEGGDRPELLAAGLRQLSENLWEGTGPNNYVQQVSQHEWIVASTGYPVHNTILLAVAELGIVTAIALFLPLLVTVLRSIKRFRLSTPEGLFSKAFFLMAIGSVVILWTGWGALEEPVPELIFLISGFVYGQQTIRVRPDAGLSGEQSTSSFFSIPKAAK